MNDKQEFIRELKALLKKHDVMIWVGCGECSDLHGVYDENIQFCDNKTKKTFHRVDGWCLSHTDLEEKTEE
jgi:sulfur relay (sulfurtransferase) complex TusBCD TusD component (DsrE family)